MAPSDPRTLRVAVCNLQTGIGTTRGYWQYLTTAWRYAGRRGTGHVESAARFLREERIDLVAFCEVEGGSRRTRGVDQMKMLADHSGLEGRAFFPTFVVAASTNQGNGVCARFPVRPVRNHPLSGRGEPRFVSEAEIAVGEAPIRFLVTHLSLQRKIRTPQIDEIAAIVRRERRPTILAGDFNVSEPAELDLLSETILEKAASAATFPSWKPRRRLDHLFFSPHFRIARAEAFDRFLFSDHLPLVVEVEMDVGV